MWSSLAEDSADVMFKTVDALRELSEARSLEALVSIGRRDEEGHAA